MTRFLAAIVFLNVALAPCVAQPSATATRLIAIGDIHGANTEFTGILKRTGLVDDQLKWSGGRATLVQTGDYTDRGADVRKVLDLLMRLEREAKSAGGQVITLLGNHEVMNLIGDWRDVTPEICATFVTPESETKREQAWKQYERIAQSRLAPDPSPSPVYQRTRDEWMKAHPPGCVEYRDAMSPNGTYGRWLREKNIAAQVGETLFMHAGVNPSRPAPQSIAEVNDRARGEIRRMDAYRRRLVERKLALSSFSLQEVIDVSVAELTAATRALAAAKAEDKPPPSFDVPLLTEAQEILNVAKWSLIDGDGPLWFRGYAQWQEPNTMAQVHAFLDQLKVTRIVVGHTPTEDRKINTRYAGRVVLIDTGMLTEIYKGTPAALEITGNSLKAIYPDGEAVLPATEAMPVPAVLTRWRPQSSHPSGFGRAAHQESAAGSRSR